MPQRPPVYRPPGSRPREERRNDRSDAGKAAQKLYGWKWRKARKTFLAEHPLCEYCQRAGRITAATVVDHRIPHRGDERLFWDRGNWVALDATCHNAAKQREECGTQAAVQVAADGLPDDPNDPWRL